MLRQGLAILRKVCVDDKQYGMQSGNLNELEKRLRLNPIILSVADVFEETHQPLSQILTRFDFQNRQFATLDELAMAVVEELGGPETEGISAMSTAVASARAPIRNARASDPDNHAFARVYQAYFRTPMMRGDEIPTIIHRFWSGGRMSDTTMRNLIDMQLRVVGSGWRQILWTSIKVNHAMKDKGLEQQLALLADIGVEILDVNTLSAELGEQVPGFVKTMTHRVNASVTGVTAKKRSFTEVKYLSDYVRLAATYLMGGVYMDTDIHPGTLVLKNTRLYHRDLEGEVPLCGAQVQNTNAYRKMRSGSATDPRVNLFTNTAHCQGNCQPVFNYFFATRAGTQSNRRALDFMVKHADDSGMTAAGLHFDQATDPRQWLVPWLMALGWTTAASDVEEGETQSSKPMSWALDFDTLVGVNNCLITAINGQEASREQATAIRLALIQEGFAVGEMLVAGPRTIAVIRRVLGINNPIEIHYANGTVESFAGRGPTIHIDHANNHFTRR